MKIAILEGLGIDAKALKGFEAPFEKEGCSFSHFERTTDLEQLKQNVKGADAVILANMPLPAEVIDSADSLKFINIAFTGVDHVAVDVAAKRSIAVSNASGYSTEAVAELALEMALSLARNVPQVEKRCRDGLTKDGLVGFELKGKTVGIVGLGKIGRRSAELFNAFGCTILAHSQSKHSDAPDYVCEVSLDELLTRSDFVVLHCPLTDKTRGLISAKELEMMEDSAYLINLARGPVVSTADLAFALNNGVIAGAAIDVFDKEPPLDKDEPLLTAKNTLVTPHVAFATKESMLHRAEIVFDNLKAWMDGHQKNKIV